MAKKSTAKSVTQSKLIFTDPAYLKITNDRIVVVIAERSSWKDSEGKRQTYKLPCGMMAAQAAHAVSKLKLLYAKEVAETVEREDAGQLITNIIFDGITTIVLKARDSDEVLHIHQLANERKLLNTTFWDTNKSIYKEEEVLTAVAIGPVPTSCLFMVTDYLSLWTCGCD